MSDSTQPPLRAPRSHGDGTFERDQFRSLGDDVLFERGVKVFHPENIEIGSCVYIGHDTILKGYYKNTMTIGDGSWIGQQCFFHSAGGLRIGSHVGIGPGVKIITSTHVEAGPTIPILRSPLEFQEVVIEDDCDLGVGAILLPGTHLGRGVQVGAGAVVKGVFEPYSVVAGVPARVIRMRT